METSKVKEPYTCNCQFENELVLDLADAIKVFILQADNYGGDYLPDHYKKLKSALTTWSVAKAKTIKL